MLVLVGDLSYLWEHAYHICALDEVSGADLLCKIVTPFAFSPCSVLRDLLGELPLEFIFRSLLFDSEGFFGLEGLPLKLSLVFFYSCSLLDVEPLKRSEDRVHPVLVLEGPSLEDRGVVADLEDGPDRRRGLSLLGSLKNK